MVLHQIVLTCRSPIHLNVEELTTAEKTFYFVRNLRTTTTTTTDGQLRNGDELVALALDNTPFHW